MKNANIVEELRNPSRVLGHLDLLERNEKVLATGGTINPALVEFHITDRCDLRCPYCTYSDRNGARFPYEDLPKIAQLQPRALVIAGGGEPSLYNVGEHTTEHVLLRLRELLPKTKFGFITNGAAFPGNKAASVLDWVRISLDAHSSETHQKQKNGNSFSYESRIAVLNLWASSGVKNVGIGYLLNKSSLGVAADFTKAMFDVTKLMSSGKDRINVQFRLTCGIQSCSCPSSNYAAEDRLQSPDLTETWKNELLSQKEKVISLMRKDSEFDDFVRTQTNFVDPSLSTPNSPVDDFDRCRISLLRCLVRADGSIFPCVMKATSGAAAAGNILTDDARSIASGLGAFYRLDSDRCSGAEKCCRIDGKKNVLLQRNQGQRALKLENPFF
ncbi:MAG: radical SAM protein [Alphaproteobacteria bacterium]|jgi:sulfatase maturation enzyme AslB (radical SAM superfamily)|nr:radical SAM protein [Alphaproteobacteria bacterium]